MRRVAVLVWLALLLAPAFAAEETPLERAARQERERDNSAEENAAQRATRQFNAPRPKPETPEQVAVAGRTLQVGPSRLLKLPSDAAKTARNGDTVEIDVGTYEGDVAVWSQHRLTLRGVGGQPLLKAAGRAAQGKAIWVIRGNDVRVENIGFADTKVADDNGAGIRAEGGNLTILGCLFRQNENGILSGANPDAEITIERSEFDRDGHVGGYAHGIYIGGAKRLTVTGSYFHGTPTAHLLKSRAISNVIAYNRIMDEADGTSSYAVDIPEGGLAIVAGNLIQQGRGSVNPAIIAYLMEKRHETRDNRLFVVNNTIVNELGKGNFVFSRGGGMVIANNLMVGGGVVTNMPARVTANLLAPLNGAAPDFDPALGDQAAGNRRVGDAGLRDLARYDYRLAAGSPAAGSGIDPAELLAGTGFSLAAEYVHPLRTQPRRAGKAFDVGAYTAGSK